MATRKEAVMNSVRSELALVNAQELMNVCCLEKHLCYSYSLT